MTQQRFEVSGDWFLDPATAKRLFEELVSEARFRKRPESWVAVAGDYFFKVPRYSNDIRSDAINQSALAKARAEYETLTQLAAITSYFVRPLMMIPEVSCLVLPRIDGENAREILIRETDAAIISQTVLAGIKACASLHMLKQFPENVTRLNYAKDPFGESWQGPLHREPNRLTLVVQGFEIRNIMMQRNDGLPILFDPHDVGVGHPEDDLARYIISLLMVTWGRGGSFQIWRTFSMPSLIESYQDETRVEIDTACLGYFMWRAIRMRAHYARESRLRLPLGMKIPGALYQFLFFHQLKRWMTEHGF